MKRRSAFVANSSSSSFIIAVSEIPKSFGDACNILFGDKQDLYAPLIIKSLFEGMKEFKIDFDRLLDMAKKVKRINCISLDYPYRDDNYELVDNEAWILTEISSNFTYAEEYGRKGYWSINEPSEYDIYFDKYVDKLRNEKFPDAKSRYDVPYPEREKITTRYYKQKAVRERWIDMVESFIRDLQGYGEEKNTKFLQGEFSDGDGSLGSKLEHGDHWSEFHDKIIFSHH